MAEREDRFRTHRIIQIDEDIRSGIYPGVSYLMEKHGVSKRTILRDIEFLRDRYNAPVESDRTHKGYYYTDPTFAIKNVLLTEGDLFNISTVMPLMEQYKNTPLEREWHKDQKLKQNKDGSVLLEFKSNQRQQVSSWVLSFGSSVEVLEPEFLRDEIRNSAERILAKYKK